MKVVYAQQNDTLDAIGWRYYGKSLVEQIMLANPHLVNFGVYLPHGTKIYLPQLSPVEKNTSIQLWS